MSSNGRFWLVLIAAVILVTVMVGGAGRSGPPLDPRSVAPDGTRALVELLEGQGVSVALDDPVPQSDHGHALLLRDRLSGPDRWRVSRWVEDGGVLVVADPFSDFVTLGGFGSDDVVARGTCSVPALAQADAITGGSNHLAEPPNGGQTCFASDGRAALTTETVGLGTIVGVASADMFTNAELGRHDNAYVALALLAPETDSGGASVLAPSTIEFGEGDLNDLIPTRVTNGIWQLLAAFLIYALYRASRLGRVVKEPLPVSIEGSELVLQAGVLSERARDPAGAAAVIRADFVDRWKRTLSAPSLDPDHTVLITQIASATGTDADRLVAALGDPIATDAELAAMAAALDQADIHHSSGVRT